MLGITRDVAKLTTLLRCRGMRHAVNIGLLALRSRLMRGMDKAWEAEMGLRFDNSDISLESLQIQSPNKQHGFSYVPCTGIAVRTLLGNIDADFSRFCFVDFGAGEGRSLAVASTYSFDEVIGVEFALELHEVALSNLERVNPIRARSGKYRSVHIDASQFPIPRRDSVLYFYNPFGEAVFGQVLANIERVYHECRPKFHIVFHQTRAALETDNTKNAELLRSAPFLTERKVRYPNPWTRFLLGSQDAYLFETK